MENLTCDESINIERNAPSEIVFSAEPGKWVMKIVKGKGILFNVEQYPDAKPNDFAQAVIEILEKHFTVKFERKEPPYDRENK